MYNYLVMIMNLTPAIGFVNNMIEYISSYLGYNSVPNNPHLGYNSMLNNPHNDHVRQLIKRDTLNIINHRGKTPLTDAVMLQNKSLAECLIFHKADINKCDGLHTPLIWSAISGDLPMVKFLLDNNADIEGTNTKGSTALLWAICNNRIKTAKYLIKNKAEIDVINNNNITPLMIAAWKNYRNIVKYLVKNNANMELKDDKGRSALTIAINENNYNVVKYLTESGSHIDHEYIYMTRHPYIKNYLLRIIEFKQWFYSVTLTYPTMNYDTCNKQMKTLLIMINNNICVLPSDLVQFMIIPYMFTDNKLDRNRIFFCTQIRLFKPNEYVFDQII